MKPQGDHTNNTTHSLLTEYEAISCVLYANTYYCQHPTIMRSNGSCMSEMLQNPTMETLKLCKIGNKPFDRIEWTFLPYSREWLISTPWPLKISMYCNNGNNYATILERVSLIEPIGTCHVVTNNSRDSNYLRTIRPNHPVFHYMPNRDITYESYLPITSPRQTPPSNICLKLLY